MSNNLRKAAELYEKAGLFAKAADCYKRLGEFNTAASLLERAGDIKGSAEQYAKSGQFEKAGDILSETDELQSLRYYQQGKLLMNKLKSIEKYASDIKYTIEVLEKGAFFNEGLLFLLDRIVDTNSHELLNTLQDYIAKTGKELDSQIAEYSVAFASYVLGDTRILAERIKTLLEKAENNIKAAKDVSEKAILALSSLPLAGFLCNISESFDEISHLSGLLNVAKLMDNPTPKLIRWEIPVALVFGQDASIYIEELSEHDESKAIANLYWELLNAKTPESIEAVLQSMQFLVVPADKSFKLDSSTSIPGLLFSTELFLPEILTEKIIRFSSMNEQSVIDEYVGLSKKVLELFDKKDWQSAYTTLKTMLEHPGYNLSSDEEKAQILLLLALASQKLSDSVETASEDFVECCEKLKNNFGIDGYVEVEKLSKNLNVQK